MQAGGEWVVMRSGGRFELRVGEFREMYGIGIIDESDR